MFISQLSCYIGGFWIYVCVCLEDWGITFNALVYSPLPMRIKGGRCFIDQVCIHTVLLCFYKIQTDQKYLINKLQRWIKNSLFYIANIEDTWITDGENHNFKPKTNTDHHNGDFNLFLVSFTHFKWLTFKELVWLIITQF